MNHVEDIARLISAAHALTRIAAVETRNETPAAQWRALSILREEGPLRLGALAALSRVTQPGMTRLVAAMDEEGLVRRSADESDSRAIVIHATAKGTAAVVAWREQIGTALAPHFSGLSDAEWATLRAAADILAARTSVRSAVAS